LFIILHCTYYLLNLIVPFVNYMLYITN
jgi:hypothetical protein